jgi:ABC-type dipeptide/oligopeptide/nickel transport system ATPase component
LNTDQRLLYDIVVDSDKNKKQELIMLIGAAGCGKSHVINEIICYLGEAKVKVCAYTASAAF